MDRLAHYGWPFFEPRHAKLALEADAWAQGNLAFAHGADADAVCRRLVQDLGCAGYLHHCVADSPDVRSIALLREVFAYHAGLADFAFAMAGLSSIPISLAGSAQQKERYLRKAAAGEAIGAFALSEPEAGSDVAGMMSTARLDGERYVLNGTKTWISNGGIAHFYTVVARSGEAPGAKGLSAFVVEADNPGLQIAERIDVTAPHPLAALEFRDCRIASANRLGEAGAGFEVAMQTLDIFRASVAGAAVGFARRALDEALARARSRKMFGRTLGEFQLTQAALADMALTIDSAALLTYRAAWLRDVKGVRTTREAAMAKLAATEGAQQVIDRAVQIFGGLGVCTGETVERLYREIRPLRIYEGASEVQKLIIAREVLK